MGESWHNSHHADPTLARHGTLPRQIDPAARTIWVLEKLNLVYDVRWPDPDHIRAKLVSSAAGRGSRPLSADEELVDVKILRREASL